MVALRDEHICLNQNEALKYDHASHRAHLLRNQFSAIAHPV